MTLDEIRETLARHGVRTVICAATDPAGVLRGKRLTVPYFMKAAEQGLSFAWFIMMTTPVDDVLPGLFDTGVPDVKGMPDLDTFRLAPWEPDTAVVLMDWVWGDNRPCELCPRTVLKDQVRRLRERALRESFALELEFFLFPRPIAEIRAGAWGAPEPQSRDVHCYSIYEGHFHEPLMARIREYFPDEVEACIPEWGQGQYEVDRKSVV